jgi:hypothetical protein
MMNARSISAYAQGIVYLIVLVILFGNLITPFITAVNDTANAVPEWSSLILLLIVLVVLGFFLYVLGIVLPKK